jgi:hypothetical protein
MASNENMGMFTMRENAGGGKNSCAKMLGVQNFGAKAQRSEGRIV